METEVQSVESEDQLVLRAQEALSNCNWTIGECAATWTKRYASGRTDADFGQLIGLSGDQVYQRRRVWESFADVWQEYPNLKWSHFYVALNWDDSAECLQWANEIEATIAEMKAWRRAQRGEDLTAPAEEEAPFDLPGDFLTPTSGFVRDASDPAFGGERAAGENSGLALMDRESGELAMTANRQVGGDDYAPFNAGARGSAPSEDKTQQEVTTEQIIKRACAALERCDASLTPAVLDEYSELSFSLQQRFRNALTNLQSKVSNLD
ncbi:MAG: hypothetical protein KDA66_16795 [Planctomycetaceae bacterium]|nr:hypothetical protein [Planctomycetaceae bacterium]